MNGGSSKGNSKDNGEPSRTMQIAEKHLRMKSPIREAGLDPDQPEHINEIIVKIEMKKFQNLINNRLKRKNNLMNADIKRVFPVNKVVDGTAKIAEAPTSFTDGIGKSHPKLFDRYEKANLRNQSMYNGFKDSKHNMHQRMMSTSMTNFKH